MVLARQIEGFGDGDVLQEAIDGSHDDPLACLNDPEDDDPASDPQSEIQALIGATEVFE